MEKAGWVPRLVAEAERLRALVLETSGQLPLHVLYDAALPALLQALQLVWVPEDGEEAGLAEVLRSFAGGDASEDEGRALLFLCAASVLMRRALRTGDEKRAARMERQLAVDLCLPILAIRPPKDSGLAPSVVAAVSRSGEEEEEADEVDDASPPAGNLPQAMERACTLLADMIVRGGPPEEASGLADDQGPRARLGECLLDLARDQARILATRLQRSGTSSADTCDDLARPHEGPFLLLRELLRRVEPAGPQVLRFRDDVLEPLLALLWTDDSSVRRVVFHELLPAFFARPQDASAIHLERLWCEVHKMWLAGRSRGPAHQHHRTFEGDAYLLMAKFVDHFLAASSSFDLRTDDQFWPFLQVGFYSSDGGVRKLANLLLKRVLAHTRQAADPATPLDFNTKYFSWPVKGNDKAWARRWETFFLLQESLEEYNYHLVAPLWPQLAALFQASREGTAMDLSWAQALLERALRHENPITQKHALLHVLHNAEYARNVTESFVLGTVMEVCCDPALFRGSLSRVTDRLLVAFLGAFFEALPDHQVGFVESLLRAIAVHKPFASGALAAYFEFLQTIPPLALFSSTSSALDDLLVIIEGHINFQPQSQRRELNGSALVLLANSLSAMYGEAAAVSSGDEQRTQQCTRLLRGVKRALALLPEELLRPSASAGWPLMQAAFAIGAHAGVAQLPEFVAADLQRLWADEYVPLQTEHETDRVARMLALVPNTDAQDRIIADILEQIRRESHNAWALVVSVLSLAAHHGTIPDRVVDALRTGLRPALAGAEPDLLRASLKVSATAMLVLSLSTPPQPDDEHSPTPLRVTLNALLRSLVEPLLDQSPDQSPSVPRQQVGGPDVALQLLRGIYHAAPLLANCSNSSAETQPAGLEVADLVLGLARSSPASSSGGRDRHAQLSRYMLLKWQTIARLLRADDDTVPSATAALVGRDVALQMLGEGAEALQAAESRCIVSILHSLRGTHPTFPLALVPCAFPDQRVDDADLELVATVLEQAWRALKESRDFETAAAFMGLAFQPAFVCTPALSREPDAPLRQYCRGVRHIGKLFRGPAGLLARQLRSVWEQHPQAAVNFIPEMVRLCVFGHVRKGENEMSGCAMDPRSLCMQDVYVRGQVWAFLLWSGEGDEWAEQRQRHHRALVEQILEALLQCNASPSYSSECRLHSHQHRKRAIGLIVGRYMRRSERVTELVRTHVLAALETPNFRNVRIVIELCGANFLLHRPDALLDHFLTFLSRVNDRPEMITSGLVVSGMVLRSLDPAHPAFLPIWLRVQPYLTCHHPTIRSIAQAAVARIVEARPDFLLGLDEGLRQQTNAVVHYLQTNAECKKVLDKHTEWLLLDTSPTSQLQPEAVLHRIPLMERSSSGEDIRPDLFALICQRPDEAARTLLLSSPDADAQPQLPLPVEGDSAAAKAEAAIFQKKITPWSVAVNAEQEEMARHASGRPRTVFDHDGRDQLTRVMSKRRQELIVVASLVDKLPNLAGLARTCEIFGASCLVLPSLKVTREAAFQSIAVTSEKWLPLVEVGEAGLVAYLRQKRAEGYALLGVEQTSGSTLLDAFTFPARCLLLLGREKQGIPPELIHLLDACIEIPQLGVIRSLNVHVSASIMVWEYTRQMRQRPKAEATNKA